MSFAAGPQTSVGRTEAFQLPGDRMRPAEIAVVVAVAAPRSVAAGVDIRIGEPGAYLQP